MEASQQLRVRKVTSWQARFTGQGDGQPGINTFQLILDEGADEYVLRPTDDDFDNLVDCLEGARNVYFDLSRKVLMFGVRGVGG